MKSLYDWWYKPTSQDTLNPLKNELQKGQPDVKQLETLIAQLDPAITQGKDVVDLMTRHLNKVAPEGWDDQTRQTIETVYQKTQSVQAAGQVYLDLLKQVTSEYRTFVQDTLNALSFLKEGESLPSDWVERIDWSQYSISEMVSWNETYNVLKRSAALDGFLTPEEIRHRNESLKQLKPFARALKDAPLEAGFEAGELRNKSDDLVEEIAQKQAILNLIASQDMGSDFEIALKELTILEKAVEEKKRAFNRSLSEPLAKIQEQYQSVSEAVNLYQTAYEKNMMKLFDAPEQYGKLRAYLGFTQGLTKKEENTLSQCMGTLSKLKDIQPNKVSLKDLAELALVKNQFLDIQIAIQTKVLSQQENPLESLPSYRNLGRYHRELQRTLREQKKEGKNTTFSTTQKLVNAINECFDKIRTPGRYEDMLKAAQDLQRLVKDRQPAKGLVNNLVKEIENSPQDESLKALLDERKQSIDSRAMNNKMLNAFATQLSQTHEDTLTLKVTEFKDSFIQDVKNTVVNTPEWKALDKELESLQTSLTSEKNGAYQRDTKAKIEAILTFKQAVDSAQTIEDLDQAMKDLNANPVVDTNRFGINQVTTTRSAVFAVSEVIRGTVQGLSSDMLVLERARTRNQQGFDVFHSDQLDLPSVLKASPQWNSLVQQRDVILDQVKRLRTETNVNEWSDQYQTILENLEKLDGQIIQAQKQLFEEESKKAPQERSLSDRVYRTLGVTLGVAREFGRSFFDYSVNMQGVKEEVVSGDRKDVFMKNFEGTLSQEETSWLNDHYDVLYERAKEDIFGKDLNNPGFVEQLKRNAQYFYNRKTEWAREGDINRQTDHDDEALKATIDAFENMSDQEKEDFIHLALVARLQQKTSGSSLQDTVVDPLKDKSFYFRFCFGGKIYQDQRSLKDMTNSVKMAPEDPENVFKLEIKPGEQVALQGVTSFALGALGFATGNLLENTVLKSVLPVQISGLVGPVVGIGASIATIELFQKLRGEGVEIPRKNLPVEWSKSFGEWFIENNQTLYEGLKTYPTVNVPKRLLVSDVAPEFESVQTEETKGVKVTQRTLDVARAKFEKALTELVLEPDEQARLLREYDHLYIKVNDRISGTERTPGFQQQIEGTLHAFDINQKSYLDKVPETERSEYIARMNQCRAFAQDMFHDLDAHPDKKSEIINDMLLARIESCRKNNQSLVEANLDDKTAHYQYLYTNLVGRDDKTFETVMSGVKMLTANPKNQRQEIKYPIRKVLQVGGLVAAGGIALVGVGIALGAITPVAAIGSLILGGALIVGGALLGVTLLGLIPKGPSLSELKDKAVGFFSGVMNFFAKTETKSLNKTLSSYFTETVKSLSDEVKPQEPAVKSGYSVIMKDINTEENLKKEKVVEHKKVEEVNEQKTVQEPVHGIGENHHAFHHDRGEAKVEPEHSKNVQSEDNKEETPKPRT